MNAKRARLPLLLLAVGLASSASAELRIVNNSSRRVGADTPEEITGPVVRWRNGEFLGGELDGATAEEVMWKAPIFSEPLVLRTEHVSLVEAPRDGVNSKEAFAI